jgi:hypothetical protein
MYAQYPRLKTAAAIAKAGIEAGATFDKNSGLPMTLYTSGEALRRWQRPLFCPTRSRASCSSVRPCAALVSLDDTCREILACHPYPRR